MRRHMVLVLIAALTGGACSDEPDDVLPPASASTSSLDRAADSSIDPAPPEPVTSEPLPIEPSPSDPVPSDSATVTPEGFELVGATVTEPDGTVCELCLWLADDADRRSRGLMSVTELGDADGMAFVYPTLHTGHFWMKNTLLPLSIAFFGGEGAYLDAFDMDPCTEDPCPLYPTPVDFLVAIETIQGGLADLGIGAGSVLAMTGQPCADPAASG